MSCILRVYGESLDLDAMLSQHSVAPDRVWRKGEPRSLGNKLHSDSGANFLASDADLDELDKQIAEATSFLQLHGPIIRGMAEFPGVQHAVLDFGVSALKPGHVAQFTYLPPRTIQLAAAAGIAIEFSVYACSEDDDES